MMMKTVKNRRDSQGFVLLFGLSILSAILTLAAVGLTRSMTDVLAANRFVAHEQALHLAESSIEVALFEETNNNLPSPWTWFTHTVDPQTNADVPVPIAQRPALQFSMAASFDSQGDYVLPIDSGGSLTMRVSRMTDGTFRVLTTATPTSSANTARIVAILTPIDLTRFFFLSPGPADLYYGQLVILDAGSGLMFINGDVELQSGSQRAIHIVVSDLMVFGAIGRLSSGAPAGDGSIRWKTPGAYDTQGDPLFFANNNDPTSTKLYNYMPRDPNPNGMWSSRNPDGTLNDPVWNDFLQGLNPVGPIDLRPAVREINTGGLPASSITPRLPTIDAFVASLKTVATDEGLVVNIAGEVPCAAGQNKSFANGLTLEMVNVIEINVAALNGCLTAPTVLYVNQAVRLTDGTDLAQPLTVVSPDSIYVKGDFNTVNPKSAAIVTGNRNYHVSGRFVDYQGFAVAPSEIDGNGRVTDAGAEQINNWPKTLTGYNQWLTFNSSDPSATLALPPAPQWLPYWAPEIKQHLMVVAPLQKATSDKTITNKNSYLEPFHQPGGYNPIKTGSYPDGDDNDGATKEFVKLRGAFINLPDTDAGGNDTRDALDPAYSSGASQDRRRRYQSSTDLNGDGVVDASDMGSLRQQHVYVEPHHDYRYNQTLVSSPPPGIRRAQQMARGVMVSWRELGPNESP